MRRHLATCLTGEPQQRRPLTEAQNARATADRRAKRARARPDESSGGSSDDDDGEQPQARSAGGAAGGSNDDDDDGHERALEALMTQVGTYDGMAGWLSCAEMPTFDKHGLGACDVKIAHIFTTGATLSLMALPLPRLAARQLTHVRPSRDRYAQAGRSATGGASGVAVAVGTTRSSRSGTPTKWALPPGTFGPRSFSLPTTAALACGWPSRKTRQ
jgi:hypothetical protein